MEYYFTINKIKRGGGWGGNMVDAILQKKTMQVNSWVTVLLWDVEG